MIDKIRFSLTMVTSTIFDSNSTRAYGWVLDMVAGGIFDFIFMGGGPAAGGSASYLRRAGGVSPSFISRAHNLEASSAVACHVTYQDRRPTVEFVEK